MKHQREWLEGLKWRHSLKVGSLEVDPLDASLVSPGCYWLMTSQGERRYWLMLLSREEEREERMDLHSKFCTRARNMFSWQSKGLFCCPGSKERQSVGQERMREIFPRLLQSASWSVCRQTVFFAKSFWRLIHRHLQTSRLPHHHFWVVSLVCPMFVVCFSIYSFFQRIWKEHLRGQQRETEGTKSEVLKKKTPSSLLLLLRWHILASFLFHLVSFSLLVREKRRRAQKLSVLEIKRHTYTTQRVKKKTRRSKKRREKRKSRSLPGYSSRVWSSRVSWKRTQSNLSMRLKEWNSPSCWWRSPFHSRPSSSSSTSSSLPPRLSFEIFVSYRLDSLLFRRTSRPVVLTGNQLLHLLLLPAHFSLWSPAVFYTFSHSKKKKLLLWPEEKEEQ